MARATTVTRLADLSPLPETIESLVREQFDRARLPGLSVGIVQGDELVHYGGFGYADLTAKRAPDRLTLSRVASITKTFTATAIMQLRDAGMLTLEDPLLLHVPEFAAASALAGPLEDVTIRRMLTHHSGLTTEAPLPTWEEPRFPAMAQVLEAMPDAEVVIPADSAWKYSNFAFGLLGLVIERLTGRPYVEYIRSEILIPLGMEYTAFELDDRLRPHFATGYSPPVQRGGDLRVAPHVPLNSMTSAGQMYSNVEDLARWLSFQFTADGPDTCAGVLDQRSLAEMHRPVYVGPDWSWGQCLGWRATRIGDRVYLNHGGGVHGFGSQVMFNVPSKTGVIVLANLWPTRAAGEIATAVIEAVLDARPAPSTPQPTPSGQPSPELTPYAGSYNAEPGIPVDVEADGELLRLVNPDPNAYTLHAPAELHATDEKDVFRVRGGRGAGERAVFRRDAAGRIEGYLLGGFFFRRTS